ncbi:MAG TPA: sulfite exporter TauE/SafE family protein [Candidatus Peribacteraceae bacterium]|nr:sulfite exporter TauE/SafE family protein [Candidatus Peribacteraceae bacterium]
MSNNPHDCHATIYVNGMTCHSCELMLERKLGAVPGIKSVSVNHKKGTADIVADASNLPSDQHIAAVVRHAGYSLTGEEMPTVDSVPVDQRKWMEIGVSLLIIFALYKLLSAFDLISLAPSTSGALSLGGIFIIGLVAGTSSCLAVTGGLLLTMAAKYNETHQSSSKAQKIRPLLYFNAGRIVSYFVLGGVVGLLGQSITLSAKMTGYMNILIALVMLYLALTILHIIPKGSFPIRPPKRLAHWIASLSESEKPGAPFALGALTFFLPCGFTQSLQLVALASGSFITGALTMGIFALGTLPSLIGISAISATASGTASRLFLRFSGSLVLLLALFNLNSGFTLTGVDLSRVFARTGGQGGAEATIRDGVQEISMKVTGSSYEPSALTIKAGVPVRWTIDGTGAAGCTRGFVIPNLNISKVLDSGPNVIEFTVPEPGQIAFSCTMGMVRGTLNVI